MIYDNAMCRVSIIMLAFPEAPNAILSSPTKAKVASEKLYYWTVSSPVFRSSTGLRREERGERSEERGVRREE